MEDFAWQQARSAAEAAAQGRTTVAEAMLTDPAHPTPADCVVLKAGGIDLLDLMKEGLLRPARVVNLRDLPGMADITTNGNGLRIGALVTLAQLADHPMVRRRYTALADAARSSASPQIRHVATLGGNLLQRPRCWYFRSAAHRCVRRGGDHCFAFRGENQYHAIFGQDGCAMVYPSTAATALLALDARVELVNAHGARRVVDYADFVVGPATDITRETDLRPGEVLTAVLLPSLPATTRSSFLKQAERLSFDWPLADVAVVLDCAGDGSCRRASVVLGAAAPVPWRAGKAESVLTARVIDAAVADKAGQAAIEGATPLPHNTYKVPMFAALVRRAVLTAAGVEDQEYLQ